MYTVFILQCQDIKNVYQIVLKKKAETSVIQIIFQSVLCYVRSNPMFSVTPALNCYSFLSSTLHESGKRRLLLIYTRPIKQIFTRIYLYYTYNRCKDCRISYYIQSEIKLKKKQLYSLLAITLESINNETDIKKNFIIKTFVLSILFIPLLLLLLLFMSRSVVVSNTLFLYTWYTVPFE